MNQTHTSQLMADPKYAKLVHTSTNQPPLRKLYTTYNDIEIFRLNNYIECHGKRTNLKHPEAVTRFLNENNANENIDNFHTRSHRFVLSKRLFPKPMLTNEKGMCYCTELNCTPQSIAHSSKDLLTLCKQEYKCQHCARAFNKDATFRFVHNIKVPDSCIVFEIPKGMHRYIDYNQGITNSVNCAAKMTLHKNKSHYSLALRYQE